MSSSTPTGPISPNGFAFSSACPPRFRGSLGHRSRLYANRRTKPNGQTARHLPILGHAPGVRTALILRNGFASSTAFVPRLKTPLGERRKLESRITKQTQSPAIAAPHIQSLPCHPPQPSRPSGINFAQQSKSLTHKNTDPTCRNSLHICESLDMSSGGPAASKIPNGFAFSCACKLRLQLRPSPIPASEYNIELPGTNRPQSSANEAYRPVAANVPTGNTPNIEA
jgi:hypothetical protein